MMGRRGWTLIEIMIVMVILGLLSGLAVLKYIDLTRTAFAAKIAGEFTVVRLAAYNYEADHNDQWPAEQGPGIVPPEMLPYLPHGFSFNTTTYQLDWDNRTPQRNPYQIAVSVTTADARLMNALRNNLGNRAPYMIVGNRLTYILIDESGNY
jgi:prepilin-type N-terminal cleavage/methylation domain-containing protein